MCRGISVPFPNSGNSLNPRFTRPFPHEKCTWKNPEKTSFARQNLSFLSEAIHMEKKMGALLE